MRVFTSPSLREKYNGSYKSPRRGQEGAPNKSIGDGMTMDEVSGRNIRKSNPNEIDV